LRRKKSERSDEVVERQLGQWGRDTARYAAGRIEAAGGVGFSDNVNPHLAWSELPAGTQSLVLICHDFDVPSRGDDVNKSDREVRPTCRAWTSSIG